MTNGLIKIEFTDSTSPTTKKVGGKDWIGYGEHNDYYAFLLDLYDNHPVHAAIIKSKVKYIAGKGLFVNNDDYSSLEEQVRANAFLSYANRYEDWSSVFRKTVESMEVFNGFAWQIIWNLGGTKCEVYPMQFAKIRTNEDGSCIYYSEEWLDENGYENSSPEYSEFKPFNPYVRKGTQVYYYKLVEQTANKLDGIYPKPEYKSCVKVIDTDIAIKQFQNDLALNGFTAQGMLTLFKGEPDEADRRKIEKLFTHRHTGVGRDKRKVLLNFTDRGDVGAEYTTFQVSDLDKQFEGIGKANLQDIITGHQVPNKSLVGVSVEGALSDRTAIDISFEQMNNTYTEPRRELVLNEVKMIAEIIGIDPTGIQVKPLKPLGIDYLNPALKEVVTKDEIRKHLGLDPLTPPAAPGTAPQGPVNENLRALSGKDWIHINRVVRNHGNGKITKQAASLYLKAYGLTDQDIEVLLSNEGQPIAQFHAQRTETDIIKMFEMAAQDDNDDEVIGSYAFAASLDNKVLELLKGEPTASANKIAKMLDEPLENVEASIATLQSKGLLLPSNQPTDKGLDKTTKPVEIEVYTVYKYVTRPDVPRAKVTRPFCKRMLELTASGKVWSQEALNNLTNELGESAWDYRGGFYTNPDTGEITPYCRHIYRAVVKTKRK